MPVQLPSFSPITFEQANPLLAGIQAGQNIFSKGVENYYLPQEKQQALQNAIYQNMINKPYANQANQFAAAKLSQEQAQPGLTRAETALQQQQAGEIAFKLKNPEYLSPDAFLLAKTMGVLPSSQNVSQVPGLNGAVAPNNMIPAIQQASSQLTPGSTAVIGAPSNVNGGTQSVPLSPAQQMIMQKYYPLQYQALQQQQHMNLQQQQERQLEASKSANNAIQLSYALNDLKKSYGQLGPLQSGVIGSHLPAVSSNAQLADQAAARLEGAMASSLNNRYTTNKDLDFAKQLGFGRGLNNNAFNILSDFTSKIQQRIMERPEFLRTAAIMGIAPADAENRWTRYEYERPVYDFNKRVPLSSNLNSWQAYLTPQAGQAIAEGKPFSPRQESLINQKSSNKVIKWKMIKGNLVRDNS